MIEIWRGTQEAEGTGFEYQQAGNSRAGVQIPLSPPFKSLESNDSKDFLLYTCYYRAILLFIVRVFHIRKRVYKKSPCNERSKV